MSGTKVCVGAIAGAYGVRGEVRIKSFCANAEDIEEYSPLTSEDGQQVFHLALIRSAKNGFVGRIAEVSGKEAAEEIQLAIEYNPDPPFDAGSPATAGPTPVQAIEGKWKALFETRKKRIREAAARLRHEQRPTSD